MIWNETKECMSRDEMLDLQGRRLVMLVKRMYYGTDYYRKKMQKQGVEPGDIKSIEDLDKLPFTTKEDLKNTYPFGMFAVPQSEIVRYHTSSGMDGIDTVVGYTRNDIDIWSECVARSIYMAGLNRDDVIQVAYNYSMFNGGLGAHYGAEKVGAAVLPTSSHSTPQLVKLIQDLGVTGIMGTPTYLLHIAQTIEEMGLVGKTKLKAAMCGVELWPMHMRDKVQQKLGIKAYDIYGLSELAGPGVACECSCQKGMHVQEDYFLAEVLNPQTLKPVPDGESGELVFTTLHKEGIPLIRYRTMDITSITHEKCECGRTTARIRRLGEKAGELLVIRGNHVRPDEITSALLRISDISASYKISVCREHSFDMVDVFIKPDLDCDTIEAERVKQKVEKVLHSLIGMPPRISIVDKEIAGTFGDEKVTVVDNRNCM